MASALRRGSTASSARRALSWVSGLAIAGLCLLLVVRDLDTQRLLGALGDVRMSYLGPAALLLWLGYVLRGLRWHYLFPRTIRRAGLRHSVGILFIGFLFNDFLPARAGELVRVALMRRYNRVDTAGVLATLFAERVLDGLVLGIVGLLSLSGIAPASRAGLIALSAGFAFLFISVLVLALFSSPILLRFERWQATTRSKLVTRMSDFAAAALSYLASLADLRVLTRAVAATLLLWGIESLVLMLVAGSFATSVPWSAIAAALAATNFASLAPTPGGLGTIEVAGTSVLELAGVAQEPAFLVITVQHALHYLVAITVGGYFAVRLLLAGDNSEPSTVTSASDSF